MNAIEWRHYQIILAIQNTGSLTGAARSVNITQSAATHQVKRWGKLAENTVHISCEKYHITKMIFLGSKKRAKEKMTLQWELR